MSGADKPMRAIDETHDPKLRSWVESANTDQADFPIQNLPFGVFRRLQSQEALRVGVAIGDQILDLVRCREAGLLEGLAGELPHAVSGTTLNGLMGLGAPAMAQLRARLVRILGSERGSGNPNLLVPMDQSELALPVAIGDYTDFYASVFHATNVGRLFRPDNPLLPNYKHVPIAYHGRSSSIVASGTAVTRPCGQSKPPDAAHPSFGPSQRLDYEMEIGAFVGVGNALAHPVALDEAESHLFGLCLLNDWSARDIQAWEYQPLGPFLAKNFATTISPWVVTFEALAPFRGPALPRPSDDPRPLPYLSSSANEESGGIDVTVEVFLRSAEMRDKGLEPLRLSRNSFLNMYWTVAQMLTHHTSNGCNLRSGDLLGSGTVSGPQSDALGCLLEITRQGAQPFELPTGETRRFLLDGDEVIFRGYCERDGYKRIGFGECRGTIVPAVSS
jgi:fumarylacetoacetase